MSIFDAGRPGASASLLKAIVDVHNNKKIEEEKPEESDTVQTVVRPLAETRRGPDDNYEGMKGAKKTKKRGPAKDGEQVEINPKIPDRVDGGQTGDVREAMTDQQVAHKERIVTGMKRNKDRMMKRYGDQWKNVMHATATKRAIGEGLDVTFDLEDFNEKDTTM